MTSWDILMVVIFLKLYFCFIQLHSYVKSFICYCSDFFERRKKKNHHLSEGNRVQTSDFNSFLSSSVFTKAWKCIFHHSPSKMNIVKYVNMAGKEETCIENTDL